MPCAEDRMQLKVPRTLTDLVECATIGELWDTKNALECWSDAKMHGTGDAVAAEVR